MTEIAVEPQDYYFTFGQIHVHSVSGKTFNKDCVVRIKAEDINEAVDKMFEVFGDKWSMVYREEPDMSFFPRGIMTID